MMQSAGVTQVYGVVQRVRVLVDPSRQANRVLAQEAAQERVIPAGAHVVQPCLPVQLARGDAQRVMRPLVLRQSLADGLYW